MNNTKSVNKTKFILVSSYILISIMCLLVVYLIIINYRKTNLIDLRLIQSHSTQLDVDKFNDILTKINEEKK